MLTIALSSRSLFHLETENKLFEEKGQEAFDAYMLQNEGVALEPGMAFHLAKKLLTLQDSDGSRLVRIIILSRNSPEAGVRIMRSIQHHGLHIESTVFTAGGNRFRFARAMNVDLFLSASAADAQHAVDNGLAAATIVPGTQAVRNGESPDNTVRIALDGDSVLFSSEADDLYREEGLARFIESENDNASVPLGEGPFKKLLAKLCEVRKALSSDERPDRPDLEIALVTARGLQSHGRVLTTLRSWGLGVDTAIFAGGLPKGPLVKALGADFFFDDTVNHVQSAAAHDVAAAHVPFGGGGIGGAHGLASIAAATAALETVAAAPAPARRASHRSPA